jgi:hypothetical protein
MAPRRREQTTERRVRRTVKIVCEGYAEVNFVKHVRSLYLFGGAGHAVSCINARGKGGRRALELALRPQVKSGADVIAILIDVDKDWDDALRRKAQKYQIQVLESTPCLEAWLLHLAGLESPGSTRDCKRRFEKEFGGEAHHEQVLRDHFNRIVLDRRRAISPILNQLLVLIGV